MPESKQIGDKRSRNKSKPTVMQPQIPILKLHNQLNTFDECDSSKKNKDLMLSIGGGDHFNEIAQSQTMSEISNGLIAGGESSNNHKRSSSSAFETS